MRMGLKTYAAPVQIALGCLGSLNFVMAALIVLLPCRALAAAGEAAQREDKTSQSALTWAHDIAPILYQNCTTCHHPGGAGPFSLLTYAEARRWGAQVDQVTQSRYMPPWLPEPGHGDFADVRRLSDADLAKLHQWIAASMPQGNPREAPKAPVYDADWQLGKPDLILKAARPYTLAAGGTDVFRNFILPYPLKESHYIRAMEIRPAGKGVAAQSANQVVHHANVLIDRTGSFRRQHAADWQAGVGGMEILLDAGNTFDPDSHFLFWKPDTPVLIEPKGMPWRLDPGNDLILNIHLKPSGKAEVLDAEIGLYFTDQPPTDKPMLLQLDGDEQLDIPAGKRNFVVEDSLTLPVDVEALGIYPHAHYLGRQMQGWATLPDGEKKDLVLIRDWDIDRQSVYRYRTPLWLPKGTVLHMRFTYDNSSANPRNPHNPPVAVHAGNRSEDEMAHMWLQVLPVNADPNSPDPRLALEEAWMRHRLEKTPDDRTSIYNLGASLVGEGKYDEAAAIYRQDIQDHPKDSRTLTALGAALEGAGDWQRAAQQFQRAISLEPSDPGSCDARYDLARLELDHGEFVESTRDFLALLSACPDDAETHERLAQAYGASGHTEEAIAQLRLAINLSPKVAEYHALLSQALDASNQSTEALAESEKAAELDPADADNWNNLGVQQARARHIEAAREAFQRALKIEPDHQQAKANLARLAVTP